jgi:hypothetical protein
LFSDGYLVARQRFREAAIQLGWALKAYAVDRTGLGGEDLSIDVAISYGARTDRTLVLSSGLHSMEGFFGSVV